MLKILVSAALGLAGVVATGATAPPSDWALNATVIEACSCPMFCQCYFNTKPAAHHDHGEGGKHFCKANIAYKVNSGHYGSVKLDGTKFWLASDLGGDFSKGQVEWGVLTYDKAMTPEQREGISFIITKLMPVQWASFKTAEGTVDTWEADKDLARASLDGGKAGEIKLHRFAGMTDDPIVIKNLKYWGAPRHDGFVLMPSDLETYKTGPNAFSFEGSNGFMLTFDISSKDVH
jgi:hypothetical protein